MKNNTEENDIVVRLLNIEGDVTEYSDVNFIKIVSDKYNLPVLAKIPMRQAVAKSADEGTMEDLVVPEIEEAIKVIENV